MASNAVGNFDGDMFGEVVIIRRGEVFVLQPEDGAELARIQLPLINCGYNESGPPTVADFDGDGFPEIGTASADYMVVADINDCDTPDWAMNGCFARGILWATPERGLLESRDRLFGVRL